MVTIEVYTLADLQERLRMGTFWDGEVIPITKHRALSQIRNPRAHQENVVLLVAHDDAKIVGYIGILPDFVFLHGEKQRVGWLTAWWANPDPKHAGIGLILMAKASKIYGGKIGASGFSDDAKKVYERSKQFVTVEERVRIKALVRANGKELLPERFQAFRRIMPLLRLLDFSLNLFCDLRLRLWRWRTASSIGVRLEYIAEVDRETAHFVGKLQNGELTKRGAPEINWIAQHPWVLAAPVLESEERRFYFSSTARESSCYMVKVYASDNVMIGFVMLRVVNGHLTVPLCYMLAECADKIMAVIGDHVVALRVHTLTVCRTELRDSLARLKFPCIARKRYLRSWILGNALNAKLLGKFEMQDGDGDCAFC